jgi:hypothetical protein
MPRALNPDDGRLTLKALPSELRAWQAAAIATDRTITAWIRVTLNQAVKKHKKREPTP